MAIPRADAALLLRRAGFGGTVAQIDALAASADRAAAVETILDVTGNPAVVRPAILDNPDKGDWEKWFEVTKWWLERMRTVPNGLAEKMALFWHTHFATSLEKVGNMGLMYDQNQLFRTQGLGSFRALTQAMALQPAMLHYLDNDPNVKGTPNENFARELMELFTLGVNQYTQDDVAASARAWTGYNTDDATGLVYTYYPNRHDNGLKTFMGITQNWNGPMIIDHILTVDPHRTTAARFIANKLWGFLAYPAPETAVLDAISAAFVASDLDITALLRAIFLRDEFYSTKARTGLVRTPTEWVVAGLKATGVTGAVANAPWWMEDMGQQLFYAPNVAGWKQNAYWISTTSVWARAGFMNYLNWKAHQMVPDHPFLEEVKALPIPDAVQLAFDRFMLDSASTALRTDMTNWLTAQRAAEGKPEYAWKNYEHLGLVSLIMLSPDFQLA